jgi:hypothetical protein
MYATSIFPSTAGTDVISGITSAISDNIGVVLTLVAFSVGLKVAVKLFNGGLHGKAKV